MIVTRPELALLPPGREDAIVYPEGDGSVWYFPLGSVAGVMPYPSALRPIKGAKWAVGIEVIDCDDLEPYVSMSRDEIWAMFVTLEMSIRFEERLAPYRRKHYRLDLPGPKGER